MPPEDQHAPKLLDVVRDKLRLKHDSIRTEDAYVEWIRRVITFHHNRHPKEMGIPDIEAFLTQLAVKQNVAASTQNQAFSALRILECLRLRVKDLDFARYEIIVRQGKD